MVEVDVPTVVNAVLAIVAAVSPVVVGLIVQARAKVSAFRKLVDTIDDAWEDGVLSDAEYDKILEFGTALTK